MPEKKYTPLTGFNIANVECVNFGVVAGPCSVENEDQMVEVAQRVKNTVMGRIKTDDLLSGYNLSCEDERFIPQVIALVDGGSWDGEASTKKYTGPKAGEATARTAFDAYLYTSDRGAGGEIKNRLEWKFPNCKGKPVKFGGEDNAFTKQPYEFESRPEDGEAAYEVSVVDEFPDEETTGS